MVPGWVKTQLGGMNARLDGGGSVPNLVNNTTEQPRNGSVVQVLNVPPVGLEPTLDGF